MTISCSSDPSLKICLLRALSVCLLLVNIYIYWVRQRVQIGNCVEILTTSLAMWPCVRHVDMGNLVTRWRPGWKMLRRYWFIVSRYFVHFDFQCFCLLNIIELALCRYLTHSESGRHTKRADWSTAGTNTFYTFESPLPNPRCMNSIHQNCQTQLNLKQF